MGGDGEDLRGGTIPGWMEQENPVVEEGGNKRQRQRGDIVTVDSN